MGAEAILKKIEEKSAAEASAIRTAGERRAQAAADQVREEARNSAQDIVARGQRDAREILEREKLKAEMECRKNTLTARRGLLDEAFAGALEKLCALDGDAWEERMEQLLLESGVEGDVEVCLSAKDQEKFGGRMAALLPQWEAKLSQQQHTDCRLRLGEPAPIRGGLFLRGAIYDVDASFEMLLQGVREQQEYAIASLLFGDGEMSHE